VAKCWGVVEFRCMAKALVRVYVRGTCISSEEAVNGLFR